MVADQSVSYVYWIGRSTNIDVSWICKFTINLPHQFLALNSADLEWKTKAGNNNKNKTVSNSKWENQVFEIIRQEKIVIWNVRYFEVQV